MGDGPLRPGLHEALLTRRLEELLAQIPEALAVELEELRNAEASDRVSRSGTRGNRAERGPLARSYTRPARAISRRRIHAQKRLSEDPEAGTPRLCVRGHTFAASHCHGTVVTIEEAVHSPTEGG